jgi:FlaG/FlaF family flagellin (archaellin)
MPFNPTLPADGALIEAGELRSQFTGLKAIVDAAAVTFAQVGFTSTLTPGEPATASVTFNNGTLTFSFGIPAGVPGEVTQAQLSNDLVNMSNYTMNQVLPLTSNNTNWMQTADITISDPPTQAEVLSLRDKLNELILALRR